MKRFIALILVSVFLAVSVSAVHVHAENDAGKTIRSGNVSYVLSGELNAEDPDDPDKYESIEVDLSEASGSGVDLDFDDRGLIVTTTNSYDPWVSILLDDIDTTIYRYFIVRYSATKEIGANHTYLMDTKVNQTYSPTIGTWTFNGMGGTGDGEIHEKKYIMTDFSLMDGTVLTGLRLTACGTVGGVFIIESIRFVSDIPIEEEIPVPEIESWFCGEDPGYVPESPNWWFNPVGEPDDRYVEFRFNAKNSFRGIHGFYYCSNTANGFTLSHMNVELIKDGATVATAELACDGDAWADTDFGKAFDPGEYSVRYSCVSGSGIENDCWCVIGGTTAGTIKVPYDYAGINVIDPDAQPCLMLIDGDNKPAAGDCNGDGSIDNKDVVVLFRYVSGTEKIDDESAYDFNNDNTADNKDVVSLFRYVSSK